MPNNCENIEQIFNYNLTIMNNFKTIKYSLVLIGLMLFSCTFNSSKNNTNNNDGIEYESQYICPMHCEGSGSSEPGNCPVCKMDYVKNENLKPQSDNEYSCPMHPEELGNLGDTCLQCHMKLEKTDQNIKN